MAVTGCNDIKEEPKPQPDKLSFEITLNSDDKSIQAKISPSSEEMPWYCGIISEEAAAGYGSDEELVEHFANAVIGSDHPEAMSHLGAADTTFTSLSADTAYRIYAFGVLNNEVCGDTVVSASTSAWPEDNYSCHIKPELLEIGVDYVDIKVTVDNSDEYLLAVPYNNFELSTEAPEDVIFAKIMEDFSNFSEGDLESFLNMCMSMKQLVYKGSQTIEVLNLITDYRHGVYLVFIDKEGNQLSRLHKVIFDTKKVPVADCTFKVAPEVSGRKVSFAITPEDTDAEYMYFHFETDKWERWAGVTSDEYTFQDIAQKRYIEVKRTNPQWSHDQIIDNLVSVGTVQTEEFEEQFSNYSYTYAVGKIYRGKSNIYLGSVLTLGEYRTEPGQQEDADFYFEVGQLNAFGAELTVTPSDNEVKYTYDVIPLGNWGEISDEEILEIYLKKNSVYLNIGRNIYTGQQTKEIKLVPDTEYALIAFGYQDGGASTPLSMDTFKTPDTPDPAEVTFKVEIEELTQRTVTYTVTPSSDSVYWQSGIIEGTIDKESLKAEIEKKITMSDNMSNDINHTITQAVDKNSSRGMVSGLKQTQYLTSRTLYTIYTVTISNDGKCMEPVLTEFTTKPFGGGTATVEVDLEKYYESVLADFIEGLRPSDSKAVIPIGIRTSDDAVSVHWVCQINMDVSGIDDEVLLNRYPFMSEIRDYSKPMYKTFDFGYTVTFIIGAKDKDGLYGPLFKKAVRFDRNGVSPIEELEEYYNSHK